MLTVEDYIEILANIQTVGQDITFKIVSSDYNLVNSLARQTVKGTPFTDRQCELAKKKITEYQDQFESVGISVSDLTNLRMPLREIDRSRWIKIVEHQGSTDRVYEADSAPFIAVRFTFQKKLISAIEQLSRAVTEKPSYDRENKIHYFPYSERSLWEIVEAFKDKNFELDENTQSVYDKISQFNANDHVPGIYNYELKNIPDTAKNNLKEELGAVSKDNILLYKDRSILYGLQNFDNLDESNFSTLATKIAHRKNTTISLKVDAYTISDVILALEELKRYPILVILPNDKCFDSLVTFYNGIKNILLAEDMSVVFRLDNTGDGLHFNQYIKDNNLNNKLAKDTKIVYTTDNKIPKPVVNSDWYPRTILVYGSSRITSTRKVLSCYTHTDLIMHYDPESAAGLKYFYSRSNLDEI